MEGGGGWLWEGSNVFYLGSWGVRGGCISLSSLEEYCVSVGFSLNAEVMALYVVRM